MFTSHRLFGSILCGLQAETVELPECVMVQLLIIRYKVW